MSFLGSIFKAVWNVFCGSSSQEQKPPSTPPGQQQQHWQQQQQHQQQHQQQQHHWQQPVPASYPPTSGHKPPGQQQHVPVAAPEHKPWRPQKYQNDNEINSANPHYKNLRARANEEGDQMAKCFSQSHDAYNRGDHAGAKQFSTQGKQHQKRMDELNKEASDWIYRENNLDSQPGEIDLHGLYVKEAIARTEGALDNARRNGEREVKLIVGKGLHSANGGAKIKPAIEDLMRKYQLEAEIDPNNAGVLIVRLNTGGGGKPRMGADEISRRIERSDESCAIM